MEYPKIITASGPDAAGNVQTFTATVESEEQEKAAKEGRAVFHLTKAAQGDSWTFAGFKAKGRK